MRTAINLFVTAMVMLSVGYITYDVLRPVDKVVTTYTVQVGDTWYGICDKHYMDNNAECFDEMWAVNMRDNGHRQLQPGDVVTITNKIYK